MLADEEPMVAPGLGDSITAFGLPFSEIGETVHRESLAETKQMHVAAYRKYRDSLTHELGVGGGVWVGDLHVG